MGARYLKTEEAVIQAHYPTATRWKILNLIPGRTWIQIMRKARKMGIQRTTKAKGNSIRKGRKNLKNAYSDVENERFDRTYPALCYSTLLIIFPGRTLAALQSHAQRRHLHRTKEARNRQIKIGQGTV